MPNSHRVGDLKSRHLAAPSVLVRTVSVPLVTGWLANDANIEVRRLDVVSILRA
jgi:hypothetical protein